MTKQQKQMMRNPEHKPLMDLPPEVQSLMRSNGEHLLRLRGNGVWQPCKGYTYFGDGYIFKVDMGAPAENEVKELPVFCGKDGIWKVTIPTPFPLRPVSVRYLVTCTGMRNFAGILYEGSSEVRSVLDTVTYGNPRAVLFK